MENNELYYEVSASKSGAVYAAYEHARAHNIKFYRVKSATKKIYGIVNGKCVVAEDGQEWFENPEYKETDETTTEENSENNTPTAIESKIDDSEPISEVEANQAADTDCKTIDINIDGDAYSELKRKYDELNEKYTANQLSIAIRQDVDHEREKKYNELYDQYIAVKSELDQLKKAVETIVAFIKR